MGKALYLVIYSRDEWWVDVEGKAHGPFDTRENAAIEARQLAMNAAAAAAEAERESEVLVPDQHGRYWIVWSSVAQDSEGRFTPRRVAS